MSNKYKIQNRIFAGKVCSGKTTAIIKAIRELCVYYPKIQIAIIEDDAHEIKNNIPSSHVVEIGDNYDLLIIGNIVGMNLYFGSTDLYFIRRKPVWIEFTTYFDFKIEYCSLGQPSQDEIPGQISIETLDGGKYMPDS